LSGSARSPQNASPPPSDDPMPGLFRAVAAARGIKADAVSNERATIALEDGQFDISFQYLRRDGTEFAFTPDRRAVDGIVRDFLDWRRRVGAHVDFGDPHQFARIENPASAPVKMWLEPHGDLVLMPPHSTFLLYLGDSTDGEPIVTAPDGTITASLISGVFLVGKDGVPGFVWGY
jgi:hypothetical protein